MQQASVTSRPGLLHGADRVIDHRAGGGEVVGQFDRTRKGHLGAVGQGGFGDLGIVGRDDDMIEKPTVARGGDRPGDHRAAAEGTDVLTGNTLAATTGGNNRDLHVRRKDVA